MNDYGWLPYLLAYLPPADCDRERQHSYKLLQCRTRRSWRRLDRHHDEGRHKASTTAVAWWYYQDAAINARSLYGNPGIPRSPPINPTGSVPKNVFNEFGANFGGPVYIPKIYTGKNKLFFFENFERTTRRTLATPLATVPTTAMLDGDFSAVTSGLSAGNTTLYDPQPGGVGPYLAVGSRPTFLSEYGCNCIPVSRQSARCR